MPRIPQDRTAVPAPALPGAPQAPLSAFGYDMAAATAIGRSVQDVGQAVGSLGVSMSHLKRQKEAELERQSDLMGERWMGEAMTQLTQSYSDFFKNEQNLQNEDFDAQFEKFARTELLKYEAEAPNDKFKAAFRRHASASYQDYSMAAFKQASKVRGINQYESVRTQINNANVEAHNMYQAIENEDAQQLIDSTITQISESITRSFGNMPDSHRELQKFLYSSMAVAVSEYDPEYSKELAMSPYMDEQGRQSILTHLEELTTLKADGSRTAFSNYWEGLLAYGMRTNTPVRDIPEEAFQATYGKSWQSAYDRFSALRREANMVVTAKTKAQGRNPAYRASVAKGLEDAANLAKGDIATERALSAYRMDEARDADAWQKDWVNKANLDHPAISRAWNNTTTKGISPEQTAVIRDHYFDVLKQYQGSPPEGATPGEIALYHDRPTQEISLLSEDSSKQWAARFQQTNLKSFLEAVNEFEYHVGSPGNPAKTGERVSDAFNDVMRLGKLNGAFELALLNRDDPSIGFYLDSLANSDANRKIYEQSKQGTYNQLLSDIQTDARFQSINDALLHDGKRSARMEDYKNGVASMAMALVATGTNREQAIDKSINLLFYKKMAAVDMGKYSLLVPKYRSDPGMPMRSDYDIEDIASRLKQLPSQFTVVAEYPDRNPPLYDLVKSISRQDIYGRNLFPMIESTDAPEEDKISMLARQLADRAVLRSTRDGQGATLYMIDDVGGAFELRDKNNQPLLIKWDKREAAPYWLDPEYSLIMAPPLGGSVVMPVGPPQVRMPMAPGFDWPNQGIHMLDYYRKTMPKPPSPGTGIQQMRESLRRMAEQATQEITNSIAPWVKGSKGPTTPPLQAQPQPSLDTTLRK